MFITDTIKKELKNIKLTESNTLLNYIFSEYKIGLLKNNTDSLDYLKKYVVMRTIILKITFQLKIKRMLRF